MAIRVKLGDHHVVAETPQRGGDWVFSAGLWCGGIALLAVISSLIWDGRSRHSAKREEPALPAGAVSSPAGTAGAPSPAAPAIAASNWAIPGEKESTEGASGPAQSRASPSSPASPGIFAGLKGLTVTESHKPPAPPPESATKQLFDSAREEQK